MKKELIHFQLYLDKEEDKELIDFINLQDTGKKSSAIKFLLEIALAQVGQVKINRKFILQLIKNNSNLPGNSEINLSKVQKEDTNVSSQHKESENESNTSQPKVKSNKTSTSNNESNNTNKKKPEDDKTVPIENIPMFNDDTWDNL